MAIITLPPITANKMSLQLVRGDTTLEFFGGSEVIMGSTKAIWVCNISLKPQRPNDSGRAWFAALTQLSNLENTCVISPPGIVGGTSYTGNNPRVSGGGQLGLSLRYKGGGSNMALMGDAITVNGEYKILTADLSGQNGTMTFEPALRKAVSNNATIEVKVPTITMRLATPVANVSTLLAGFYNMNVPLIETQRA